MTVFLYHKGNKFTSKLAKFKTISGAMKAARRNIERWQRTGCNWMLVWIGEDV